MILSKSKHDKYQYKYQQHLLQLPKISQSVNDIEFIYNPSHFREILLKKIANARWRICIVTLYLEQDEGGYSILNALYKAKRYHPNLDIYILVDWHRARRGRIGTTTSNTNADWYCHFAQQNPDVNIPIFGILINKREALGVLHFKGFIIDHTVLYSGASLNNVYLHQIDKYRYDRYHLIRNEKMANIMFDWIKQYLIHGRGVCRLNIPKRSKNLKIKNNIRLYRRELRNANYSFQGNAKSNQLSVTPLVGLGKSSLLNKTIYYLISCVKKKLIICTPYFNLPTILVKKIIKLLKDGKEIEIITGDKTANDFFIKEDKPFKVIYILPYLYEINLRKFLNRLQYYVNNNQLTVRLWKNQDNSYHLKGMWIDSNWILLTSNNLNTRGWYLDLENAILIHDPNNELNPYRKHELNLIRAHTKVIHHYHNLQNIADYPVKIRKFIRRLRHIQIDRIIRKIL